MTKTLLAGVAGAIALAVVAVYMATQGQGAGPTMAGASAPAPRASGAGGGGGGGPVSVTTVAAQMRDVDVVLEATGTVTALNSVELRPQVAATVTRVHIREGQYVATGQLLFTLDARNDEVNVTKARAQLARDQAALADAERQLARSRELVAQNFISQGALDTNQTLVESQKAAVAASRAAVDAAQVGLSFSRITAPAAGRAGAIDVFAGTLVQPSGSPLVTITQLNPIAVTFNVPQRNLGEALATLRGGGGTVRAVLPDGGGTVAGRLGFVDNAVDAASGTVRVKAQFANADERLWPGAFVAVEFTVRTLKDAVVVPQAAIIQSPRGTVVYVVGADGKAALQPIEVVHAAGEFAAVSGLAAGARVVLDGRQNLRPGGLVIERSAAASAPGRARSAGPGASGAASGAAPASPV